MFTFGEVWPLIDLGLLAVAVDDRLTFWEADGRLPEVMVFAC